MIVRLVVNGSEVAEDVPPRLLLSDFLRHRLGLTGTHVGCEHGVCGACNVLLDGRAVRSCLLFAVQLEGQAVTTVEGLAAGDELHPAQRALLRHRALQCGFCTPGIAVALSELGPELDASDGPALRELLAGNLCRCTGYGGIVAAAEDVAG
jgi:aerobic carbon-monoxide dehydrogenase small subunit